MDAPYSLKQTPNSIPQNYETTHRTTPNEILHPGVGRCEVTVIEVGCRGPKKVPPAIDKDSTCPYAVDKAAEAPEKVGTFHETHSDAKVNFITVNA